MPFRADLAVEFVDQYARYLEFHSTLDVLKGIIHAIHQRVWSRG